MQGAPNNDLISQKPDLHLEVESNVPTYSSSLSLPASPPTRITIAIIGRCWREKGSNLIAKIIARASDCVSKWARDYFYLYLK
jgi:hypothetical protein